MIGEPKKLDADHRECILRFLETARDENRDIGNNKKYTYDQVLTDLLLYLENIKEL